MRALACTGDPLLDALLRDCRSLELLSGSAETPDEAVRLAIRLAPDLLFVSPALGDLTSLPARVQAAVVCLLEEGAVQAGVETCAGAPLTAAAVDAYVAGRSRTAAPPVPPPATSKKDPALAKPTAGFRAPALGSGAGPSGQTDQTPARRPAAPTPQQAPRPAAPDGRVSVVRQRIVALWGGKPGAGRSTLAAGLSDLLSRMSGLRVCVVDLNPYHSSLATIFGKDQEVNSWFHITDAIRQGAGFPEGALHRVQPNLALITGPAGRPEWVQNLTPEAVDWLVDSLRSRFDYILLDLEARPGPVAEAALRLAQTVLITVAPDFPDVVDTQRALEQAIAGRVLERSRCRLVLSRWVETPALPASMVAEYLSLPVGARIPAGAEGVIAASAQGLPVTSAGEAAARPVAAAMSHALGLVLDAVAQEPKGLLRGLFQRA